MTCHDHLLEGARYAALALSDERPSPDEVAVIGPLRDDVLDNLSALVTTLACREPDIRGSTAVASVARDPVGALASHLATLPRMAPDWDRRPSPLQRYSGRPRNPWEATTLTRCWQGLGAETLFAAHDAYRVVLELSDGDRWSALHDVAVLTQAFASLEGDLATQMLTGPRLVTAASARVGGVLALKGRELAALADASGPPLNEHTDRRPRASVVPISRLASLPLATERLELLLREAGPTATAQDLMAATIALAKSSLAASRALDSGASAPQCGLPAQLRETATVLSTYSGQLHTAILDVAPRLGSIHRGTPGIHQQAGEIGGEATRRMLDLVPRPAAADAASPHLLEFATRLGAATQALQAAVDAAHHSGRLYERDRSTGAPRGWAPTRDLGSAPLSDALVAAYATATAVPPPPRGWTPSPFSPRPAAITDLVAVLRNRHEAERPQRPGAPRWGSPPVPTR